MSFLRNTWYVAAWAWEVTPQRAAARRLLDEPVLLLRDGQGHVKALADRCPHRFVPLSMGRILPAEAGAPGRVQCGYHGLQFDFDGRCVHNPRGAVPKAAAVRPYPVVERHSAVWIWMGDPARAADAPPPHPAWLDDPQWQRSEERLHLRASYVRLHENLLDLTHLSFLHARTFGTPDYARAPYEVSVDAAAGRFSLMRHVAPTRLPPIWGRPTGLERRDAARVATSTFLSPALHEVQVRFFACDRPEHEQPSQAIRTAHIVTPETSTTTHYFIQHGRNFAQHDPAVTAFMHEQLLAAFQEDIDGLEAIEQNLAAYAPGSAAEISFQADRPSLAMRRWLRQRAMAAG